METVSFFKRIPLFSPKSGCPRCGGMNQIAYKGEKGWFGHCQDCNRIWPMDYTPEDRG